MDDVVSAFLHLLDDTESLIKRSRDRYLTDDLERFLHDFRTKRVNPLYRRLERMKGSRYVLSMVGLTNVGKSTLAHALLGHPVAPRRNQPATAIPVEYEFSHEWQIKTFYRETQRVSKQPFEKAVELSKALEPMVFSDGTRANGKSKEVIERIIVRGPMDLLKGGIVFADTPGFGAAQTEGDGPSHQLALVKYLTDHVHEVMFCVSGSNAVVSPEEEECFRSIQELCSTVIVTKWNSDPEARSREEKRYEGKFANLFPYCRFMFVEAKWAIEGKEGGGIEDLHELIQNQTSKEKRAIAIREQVVSAWEDLHELAHEPLQKSGAPLVPWHQASLPRFFSAASGQNLQLNTTT